MTMLVTIGLVVKNCEATIRDTVESIVNQDYPLEHIEVILVDDGSNDSTVPMAIEGFSKTKMNVVSLHTGGSGLGEARQMVVDNAEGKYIVWVDGDMTLPENHVGKQVKFMEAHPRVGKARAKWHWIRTNSLVALLESTKLEDYESKHSGSRFTGSMLVGIGGSICRLDALKQTGGFDLQIKGAGEDIDIAAKMLKAGWELKFGQAEFFHGFKETWKELWTQYFWYGYGTHYVSHKHKGIVQLWTRIPMVTFFSGLLNSISAYRVNYRALSFVMPLHNVFKQTAWCFGFARAHLDNYEPRFPLQNA